MNSDIAIDSTPSKRDGYAIVEPGRRRVSGMRNKALDPERNASARKFVEVLVKKDFGGNTTGAAKQFGISQSLLYEFLAGTRGAGMKLLDGVSRYSGQSIDAIVGKVPAVPSAKLSNLDVAVLFFGDRIPAEAVERVRREAAGDENARIPYQWGVELARSRDALTGEESLVTGAQRRRAERSSKAPPSGPESESPAPPAANETRRRRAAG